MSTISEDELHQVQTYIEQRFEQENDLREHPWKALKVDESQMEVDLEKQYTAR